MRLLENGDILQKQISALKLETVRNNDEARIFVSNLVGVDGKVREAVSFRLIEFAAEAPELFAPHYEIFLQAVLDINGNVCRNVIAAMKSLPPECFCDELINMTREILSGMPQTHGYKVNREIFKLYWCLEAIGEFCKDVPVEILHQTAVMDDYTIREKTAKIVARPTSDPELLKIRQALKSDPNYFVRKRA